MGTNNILFEIILSNQCNKRCEYCDLNFRNESLENKYIDALINLVNSNSDKTISINYFGGEPLLEFQKIKIITYGTASVVKKFSIGTNGQLISKEILDFLKKFNFSVNLSVDNIDNGKYIDLDLFALYSSLISINLILDPDYISFEETHHLILKLINLGFKNFNLMPVYTTKIRKGSSIKELGLISNFISSITNIRLNKFGYFNGITTDTQYILDTDGYLYQDIDSLLWLQKQYKILPNDLKLIIERKTKISKIGDVDMMYLFNNYNIKELVLLLGKIPQSLNQLGINKVIDGIINNRVKI